MSKDATEWTFGYAELAKATGLNRNTVVKHRTRGWFDPEDIASVAAYLARYGSDETREKIIDMMIWRQVPDDPGGWKKARKGRGRKRST